MSASTDLADRLRPLPVSARKLLCVIARQAYHGALRSKPKGIATMPEVHEACGLDVDAMYSVLQVLRESGVIQMEGEYPFEEIRFMDSSGIEEILSRCETAGIPLEDIVVELRFDLVA